MNSTVDRIKHFIDLKGISVRKFEENVGFSNGAFASQYKNNKTIGVDKVENILRFYPEINPEWLLTGNGEILKTKGKENVTEIKGNKNSNIFSNKPNVQKKLPFEKQTAFMNMIAEERAEYGNPLKEIDMLKERLQEQKELYTEQIQFLTSQIETLIKDKEERIQEYRDRIQELKGYIATLKNVSSLDDTQRGVG